MRRGQILSRIFEIPDHDLPIHYATFMTLRLKQMELSAKTVYGPVLNSPWARPDFGTIQGGKTSMVLFHCLHQQK